MAPVQPTEDYYAVLEIDRTADLVVIKSSYRRLARLRHPDKVPDKLKATADFQLLQQAYSTLSDPDQRRSYDRVYDTISKVSKPYGTNSKPTSGTSSAHESGTFRTQSNNTTQQTRLRNLRSAQVFQTNTIAAEKEKLYKLQAELRNLQTPVESSQPTNSGWSYLTSLFFTPPQKTAEEKLKEERARLDRAAAAKVKQRRLDEQRTVVQTCEDKLRKVVESINALHLEILTEKIQREQAKQEETKRRAEAEAEAKRAAEAAKRYQEAGAQREKQRAEEAKRAAETARREQEAWAQHLKRCAEETAKAHEAWAPGKSSHEGAPVSARARAAAAGQERHRHKPSRDRSTNTRSTPAACKHRRFWPRVEGSQECSRCLQTTRRFAFQCPLCARVACAPCRELLKQEPS